ncbi:MAG: hypothetical protein H0V01_12035 [Bacteroidetes bacterium]|nr:hypothetical protein [Bacteroidota bacterium]HET6245188.1 hypothetical protein [Bacteroidia bacterium]
MKAINLLIIGIVLVFSGAAKAQVNVNVNIGSPPQWGPVGYSDVRYYYLPDVEAYYDVHTSMFIYYGGGAWIHRSFLPSHHKHYDLYSGYKVVMVDYHGNSPFSHHDSYKIKYKKGYKGGAQKTIGPKPGKGNSNAGGGSKSHSNNQAKQGNNKSAGSGNVKGGSPNNNMQKSQGTDGGKGKSGGKGGGGGGKGGGGGGKGKK